MEENKKKPLYKRWWVYVVGVLVLFTIIGASGGDKSPTEGPGPETQVQARKVFVGDEGVLNYHDDVNDCSQKSVVAVDEKSEDVVTKASVANDTYGIAELVMNNQAFLVPNCTKVQVIDQSFAIRKIRILEGDQIGKSGWVPMEFVK